MLMYDQSFFFKNSIFFQKGINCFDRREEEIYSNPPNSYLLDRIIEN